jgi:hypothetical protein
VKQVESVCIWLISGRSMDESSIDMVDGEMDGNGQSRIRRAEFNRHSTSS